ncbi:MAG: hypothetical protein GY792_30565 [Gammaproteobacteria bacterium]|nr:hypothetical protein [Gammaproteobacteria bacterium]
MENSARVFNCARCQRQVVICRRCDRGNIYCGSACSHRARCESQRTAARRYQHTHRGRLAHAQRQRRYRSRGRKVTHQGSTTPPRYDSLRLKARVALMRRGSSAVPEAQGLYCHFCHRLCIAFVRLDFLHSSAPRRFVAHPGWP